MDAELHEKMGRVLAKLESIESHLSHLNSRTSKLEHELDMCGRACNQRLDSHFLNHEKADAVALAKADTLFSRSGATKLFAFVAALGAGSAALSRAVIYWLENGGLP